MADESKKWVEGRGGDEELHEKHPSYVLVSFSRRGGHPGRLFGSALRDHGTYITLSVRNAEVIHNLGRDTYYGGIRGNVLEVDMSAAQFAELLTTMNIGSGVPGTLRYLDGKEIPKPPEDADVETDKILDSFRRDMAKVAKETKERLKELDAILEKKTFSQADKKAIRGIAERVVQQIEANAPFMVEQFQTAAEKTVTSAKAEIDSFMTHAVITAGVETLALKGAAPVPVLPGKKEDNDG